MSQRVLEGQVEAIWHFSTKESIRVGERVLGNDMEALPVTAWFQQAISEMPDGAKIRMTVEIVPPEEEVVWP